MNKAELIDVLATKTGLNKKQVEDVLQGFEDTVTETIKAGMEVTLTGFGTFMARPLYRTGVNPQRPTEKIQIAAVRVPKFKAGKSLKDALKKT